MQVLSLNGVLSDVFLCYNKFGDINMEFSRFSKMIGEEKVKCLQQKTVLVVGLGGVGGYVVESLARSGIGKLILVDFDTIDPSNINRQLIALHSTIGKKKGEVWTERVKDINPNCETVFLDLFYQTGQEDKLFQDSIDYVVDACDTISSKKQLIVECFRRHLPFLSCMGTGNRLDPSKLYLTDLRKTEGDPLARILRRWVKDEKIVGKIPVLASHELPIKIKDRTPGSSSFVPSAAGLLIASKVVRDFIEM